MNARKSTPESGAEAQAPGDEPLLDIDDITIIEPLCAIFRRKLREDGAKYTPERARVLDAIIDIDEPFEPEQLLERLKDGEPRVSKATIYRTIKLLQDAGIIHRTLQQADQALYQLVYGSRPQQLLVMVESGERIEIDAPELDAIRARIEASHGVTIRSHRLEFYAVPAKPQT